LVNWPRKTPWKEFFWKLPGKNKKICAIYSLIMTLYEEQIDISIKKVG
jgi:hypothetical protein